MKTNPSLLVACVAVCAGLLALPAHAATEQQNKMTTCNAEAKSKTLSGTVRQAFMKSCLSSDANAVAAPATSQQDKMKTCNADAGKQALKGDARKQFMSSCLKAK
jgi:psiF repeat